MNYLSREKLLNISENSLGQKYSFIADESGNVSPLGQGGSGIVYLANQRISNNGEEHLIKRAIKFFAFRDDLIKDYGYVSNENFRTELENIVRFNHPNILKVIDGDYYKTNTPNESGELISIPYTVTEYIDGPSLDSLLNKDLECCKKVIKNENDVFSLFSQILSGIEYLHNNNFYHCDIAPKNIFIKTDSQEAVIGDLGAGKTLKPKAFDNTRVIGTKEFMPKQVLEMKNSIISYDLFCSFQPMWDIFSTVLTLIKAIQSIKAQKVLCNKLWNLDRLEEKLNETSYTSISEIKADVEALNPKSIQILALDELSEASNNVRQILLPINSVYLSQRMMILAKHQMLLRLIDVPQLLEGATNFPGANHTRYEHSLGTYELMRKAMIALLRNKTYAKFFSKKNVIIGLLAALLSSLHQYPYSYTINELRSQSHDLYQSISPRALFNQLISETSSSDKNQSIMQLINELFEEYSITSEDLEYVIFGKNVNHPRDKELDVLNYILNSSIGVRVLDYMMRDSHHIGLTNIINTEDLFKSMVIFHDEFYIKQSGISSAEQIITNRYWLFKRIYWNDPNRAYAALLKHIFFSVYRKSFEKKLKSKIHTLSKYELQKLIKEEANRHSQRHIIDSLQYLNNTERARYKSIVVLDKNSEYPHSNDICSSFFNLSYSEQHTLRDDLEEALIKHAEFNLSSFDNKDKSAILLIDMPYPRHRDKYGEDIRILRYDNSYISLSKASGIVSGLDTTFEDHLKLLRIFIRPDVYEAIEGKKESIKAFLCEKLYDSL